MSRIFRKKTLIEFITVFVVIAVLLLVSIPKFLDAQTRAKVARVYGQLDQVRIAVNAYRIDHNKLMIPDTYREAYFQLTSPVPYLENIGICIDPFLQEYQPGNNYLTLIDVMFLSFHNTYSPTVLYTGRQYPNVSYLLWSIGPSLYCEFGCTPQKEYLQMEDPPGYCPTNGLNSIGLLMTIDSGVIKF